MSPSVLQFAFVVSTLILALPVKATLGSDSSHVQWEEGQQAILEVKNPTEWDLDKFPNPNDTNHLVFETVHSLLQHWPNTRMRNGHNIVPGVIPKGTLLYHGGATAEIPTGREWVATDPEHSYLFCEDEFENAQKGCWHLTLATSRPLKVIYFDGNSAAKMSYGTIDTQDLVAWGKFGTGYQYEERQRFKDLCKWGENFGVDGFVRMEMDFEVMVCNFTSGLSVVSFANLVSRGFIRPLATFVNFEVIDAGSWHNHFPGDTRIQLDLAGLVSLYDTELAPSLVPIRAGQERWDHRVRNISSEDISAVKSRLEAALVRPSSQSSGIDWETLIQVIVDRYAGRLELTRHLLNSSAAGPSEILDLANKTQTQLRIMLTPYILFSAVPTDPSNTADLDWARPIYKLCATIHTGFMHGELDSMTDSEKLLLRAVRGTSGEICRVVTRMWAVGVYAGIDQSLNTKATLDITEVARVWNTWARDLERLMAWLDWNVWVKCNPACGPEEMCYLPTWPLGFPRMGIAPGRKPPRISDPLERDHADDVIITLETDEWFRPQPKCIRRLAPHKY